MSKNKMNAFVWPNFKRVIKKHYNKYYSKLYNNSFGIRLYNTKSIKLYIYTLHYASTIIHLISKCVVICSNRNYRKNRWNKVETIGSIIYLKEGSQKLMIINRGPIIEIEGQKYIFDYSACKYPVGVVEDQIYYFNEENIDEVIFEGYSDQDEMRFQALFKGMKNNLDDDIQRGMVQQEDNLGLI